MATYAYRRIEERFVLEGMYRATAEQGLLGFMCPGVEMTEEAWLAFASLPEVLVLGGYVDGTMGGYLVGRAFVPGRTRCMEVAVCAFRPYAEHAAALSRGGYMWCFDNLECTSLVGRTIVTNRHALRMAPEVGFGRAARLPELFWSERKGKFMDGWLLLATRESVAAAIERGK